MNSLINSLSITIPSPDCLIQHSDKILLMGSCFTEHITKRLRSAKISTLENPHGILFNPRSVSNSLAQYIHRKVPKAEELVQLNEIWNHWDFHSDFSAFEKEDALEKMTSSIEEANDFLKEADWLIITLGSAFQYFLIDGDGVANCHRAPGQWFDKHLLPISLIVDDLERSIEDLKEFNPKLKLIFTISPVRHVRDGVVENNRSKARLIEAVHELVEQRSNVYYFPSYELLIDVLRDYRFYDSDLVHPNYAATQIVWEQFLNSFIDPKAKEIIEKMQALDVAKNHKVRFPKTNAFKKFQESQLSKIKEYEQRWIYIDFSEEKEHFGSGW